MYFDNLNSIIYDFEIKDKVVYSIVKDITVNMRFKNETFSSITLYDEYDLVDGDTPEIVSEKIYGTPKYNWAIMLANESFDWVNDFPLNQQELESYVSKKYSSPYDIHHYQTINKKYQNSIGEQVGYIVGIDYVNPSTGLSGVGVEVEPVTNIDYEYMENELKRRIKIVSPIVLQRIIASFEEQ